MDWLTKKWDVDQQTIEFIMAADKQSQQTWFNQLETEGYDFLILDRYILSQYVYGVANGMDGKWIKQLHTYMRTPDLDIVIDIPAEVSMMRKGKHNNGENDRYESDLKMLNNVRHLYRNVSTSTSAPIKKIVDGTKEISQVNEEIYRIVKEVFIRI